MASLDTYDAEVDASVRMPPVSRLAGWLGAILSLGLAAALAWWITDLILRDVRGVPVVRAMEGPARAAPEDPGGFQAAHQGLSVNSVPSETTAPLADRVVLAPPPTGVSDEDLPLGASPERDAALKSAIGAALMQAIGGGDGDAAAGEDAGDGGLGEATPPHSQLSPRPQQRPDLDLVTRASFSASQTLPQIEAPRGPLDPATLGPGIRLVQLGVYDSADGAETAWRDLTENFETYMEGKARVIERAEMSDQEFWRLRAHGFDDLADARGFCAVLLAEQADCIPVLTR